MPRIAMLEGYDALDTELASAFEQKSIEVIDLLDQALADLRQSINKAVLASATREGLLNGLGTFKVLLSRLQSKASEVLAGQLTIDRWFGIAQTIRQGIDEQAKLLHEESFFRLVGERLDVIAGQLQRLGANLEEGLNSAIGLSKYLLPGLLIGGGAILLWNLHRASSGISLREGRRGKLAGYKRKRARR